MKYAATFILFLSAFASFAEENTLKTEVNSEASSRDYVMEPTFAVSSINGGTKFIGVALLSDVASWLSLGVDGNLPFEFEKQDQIYSIRGLARIHLLKTYKNNVFIQGALTQGFYNDNDVTTFASLGMEIGFMQNINQDWDVGARLGAEYASARFENGSQKDRNSFYNRVSVVGAYHF